jgi:Spy/CpxP family protein refolding chaperone
MQASALQGNTSTVATTASHATAFGGGGYDGSGDAPGMYGGIAMKLTRNQAADHPKMKMARKVYMRAARTRAKPE